MSELGKDKKVELKLVDGRVYLVLMTGDVPMYLDLDFLVDSIVASTPTKIDDMIAMNFKMAIKMGLMQPKQGA
jgi:hypothetical protein